MTEKVRPLTLMIDKGVWMRFKKLVPRTEKLNDAVAKLVEAWVKQAEEEFAKVGDALDVAAR